MDQAKQQPISSLVNRDWQNIVCLWNYLRQNYQMGEYILCEENLAELLSINRLKLRELMGILQMLGLIERRRGAGTFLTPPHPNYLAKFLSFFFKDGIHDTAPLRRLQVTIQIDIAEQAANHWVPGDLTRIVDPMQAQKDCCDWDSFLLSDQQYHFAIIQAAHDDCLFHIGQIISLACRFSHQHRLCCIIPLKLNRLRR
ncbi:MAG: hypothetical protein A3E37_04655 [Candidatus Andersenbacteria bacterium RIFCSPHIGHO2_12_FULL_46_9]|nr:MAG: DNA-binding transcriptional repressor UxuR [Parcubacteria group bacterium GW2011_GWA2_45_14]OGY33609.1 MAG: hypothetical protein A3B76_04745 [Candidatus Andersenbacteria bacterium RIFCSPHIGHO2_02_FULL_46_16]OGY36481.1 MAG: hypothetical protein A3I08_04305 [Candidatus Andersenbacteria bacterium RIFCSPLOWO2_02_FULL_46_11]OGY37626.1 MAG: hypothetical protein A3E37_04655 [Candidatus Andersenbacteria bacterium RIFCSPHIGHO2_12_FULL_46_9]OGY41992.1 MAG: hypothetical protein A3G57_01870 [Candid